MKLSLNATIKNAQKNILFLLTALLLSIPLTQLPLPATVKADTAPPTGTLPTVSADPLPTVQIQGIVWDQVTVGNKVYATGKFTTARPAGVARGGAGTVTRNNLLAYDITTGALDTTFTHSLTSTTGVPEGKSLAVSPDKTKLYVGGSFTTVDGQARANIAGINLTTNTLMPGFAKGTNNVVQGLAATNTAVYLGGDFTVAGGLTRNRLAAYNSAGSLMTWAPSVNSQVKTLIVSPNGQNIIFAGGFNTVSGQTRYASAAANVTTGALIPWGSSSSTYRIRQQVTSGGAGIYSLSTDGVKVFMTGWTYSQTARPGTFEGRAAIDPANGNILWINDCAGDTYDSFPVGGVLYSVGHSHNCSPVGGFPEIPEQTTALAQTTQASGVNGAPTNGAYTSFSGFPKSELLNWFPVHNRGTVSGSSQAAWTVTGNATYIALGGEFTTANGSPQEGLVRYGIRSVAPNKIKPTYQGYPAAHVTRASTTGVSTVYVYNAADADNGVLTYKLYLRNGTTLLATKSMDSRFWKNTYWTTTISGLEPGSRPEVRVVVSDPLGNVATTPGYSAIDDNDPEFTYSGTWTNKQAQSDVLHRRGQHYTTVNGNSYTLKFAGSSISLYGQRASNRGNMSISIDGGPAQVVSAYNAKTYPRSIYFMKTGLTTGTHTMKVTKVDGTYMDVDAAVVDSFDGFDDMSKKITYAGTWSVKQPNSTSNYGGGHHYTGTNGAKATFTFTGTQVAFIASKASNYGNVAISIDGGTPVTVSTTSTTTVIGKPVYVSPVLASGTHTISVTKKSGTWIDVDGFIVKR